LLRSGRRCRLVVWPLLWRLRVSRGIHFRKRRQRVPLVWVVRRGLPGPLQILRV
jgi:hypothetical protein